VVFQLGESNRTVQSRLILHSRVNVGLEDGGCPPAIGPVTVARFR
jgi:hypothetical protein